MKRERHDHNSFFHESSRDRKRRHHSNYTQTSNYDRRPMPSSYSSRPWHSYLHDDPDWSIIVRMDGKIISRVRYYKMDIMLPKEIRISEITDLKYPQEIRSLVDHSHHICLVSVPGNDAEAQQWYKLISSLHAGKTWVAVLESFEDYELFLLPPPLPDSRAVTLAYYRKGRRIPKQNMESQPERDKNNYGSYNDKYRSYQRRSPPREEHMRSYNDKNRKERSPRREQRSFPKDSKRSSDSSNSSGCAVSSSTNMRRHDPVSVRSQVGSSELQQSNIDFEEVAKEDAISGNSTSQVKEQNNLASGNSIGLVKEEINVTIENEESCNVVDAGTTSNDVSELKEEEVEIDKGDEDVVVDDEICDVMDEGLADDECQGSVQSPQKSSSLISGSDSDSDSSSSDGSYSGSSSDDDDDDNDEVNGPSTADSDDDDGGGDEVNGPSIADSSSKGDQE